MKSKKRRIAKELPVLDVASDLPVHGLFRTEISAPGARLVFLDRKKIFAAFLRSSDGITVSRCLFRQWVANNIVMQDGFTETDNLDLISQVVNMNAIEVLADDMANSDEADRKAIMSIIFRMLKKSAFVREFQEQNLNGEIIVHVDRLVGRSYEATGRFYGFEDRIEDPYHIDLHRAAADFFFGVMTLVFLMNPSIRFYISEEDRVSMVAHSLCMFNWCSFTEGEPLFKIEGEDFNVIRRRAIRKEAVIQDVNHGLNRLSDFFCKVSADVLWEIRCEMISRCKNKGLFGEQEQQLFETASAILANKENNRYYREVLNDNGAAIVKLDTAFLFGLDALDEGRRADRYQEGYDKAKQESDARLKDMTEKYRAAESDRAYAVSQKAKYESVVECLKEENAALRGQIAMIAEEPDDIIPIADLETAAAAELPLDIRELSEDQLDKLRNMKVIVVGGHKNFHNLLTRKVENWRCFDPRECGNIEAVCKHAEVVVFMTNYISHTVYNSVKRLCANAGIPMVMLNSNNVDLCLGRIAQKIGA